MPLSSRIYQCGNCGMKKERDFNASLNLEYYRTPSSGEIACGDSSQPKSIAQGEPKKQEVNVKPTASSAKVCSTRQVCVSFSERSTYPGLVMGGAVDS